MTDNRGFQMFTKYDKRKYAQAMRRIEIGIWGHKKSLFRTINLTTRAGDDNSPGRFIRDFRKMIKWLRSKSLGRPIEYCCALGYTPENELLHVHGLLRVKGGYLPVSRRELGDKWNELHGAFAVKMAPVKSYGILLEYVSGHIMKDYSSAGMIRSHFLVSRGWRNHGYENIVEEVKEWYLNGIDSGWLDSKGWRIVNKVIKGYCEHKDMIIKADFGHVIIRHGRVVEAEIYGYE